MSDILYSNFIDGNNSSNVASFVNFLDGGLSNTTSYVGVIDGTTSENRIKERISGLVRKQFPEFIQSDYTLFVTFVEAYYKFLELDFNAQEVVQNARSYNDIDRTAPAFVYYFLKNYAPLIPATVLADKKLLVKKINDLYQAKGSTLSFKLLFRLLFNETVDIKYPYENVLRASDGVYRQKATIFVETVSGDRSLIENRFLSYTVNGASYQTPILGVKYLTSTLAEVSLDNSKIAPIYNPGDLVLVYGARNTLLFTGLIKPTTTTYNIVRGGAGFRVGQIYTVNFGTGVGTLVKVNKVSSTGAIQALKFINYGFGFTKPFTISLDKDLSTAQTADLFTDSTQNETDSGTIYYSTLSDANNYFAEDYLQSAGYTYTSFKTFSDGILLDPLVGEESPPDVATVSFSLGGLARYPGAYTTNRGFVSDLEIRLEDDLLYQPFAYQITSGIDITKFFDIVKQLLHPAGQRMFNNRVLDNFIDLSANVSSSRVFFGNIRFEAYDSVDPASATSLRYVKDIEFDDVTEDDTNIISAQKPINESQPLVDNNSFNLNVVISDVVELTERLEFNITPVDDEISELDSIATTSINKNIDNTDSEISTADSGVITNQSYAISSFFLEDYTGTSTTF